jgi:hypothetical protein
MYILGNLSINDTYFMLKPYREESESSHESPPIAQSEPSTITRQDSSVEAPLEPQTLKGEEIQPSKFTSKFEDDHSRYLLDTLNSFVSQTVEDPHSVQIIHSKISRQNLPLGLQYHLCLSILQMKHLSSWSPWKRSGRLEWETFPKHFGFVHPL